jgi:uncharacterized protein YcbX
VSGVGSPFSEDKWHDIEFNSSFDRISMKIVKPCSRCKIPSVNIHTGVMDPENKITKLLKTFRTGESMGLKKDGWQKQVNQHFICNIFMIIFLIVEQVFVGQNADHGGREGGTIRVGDKLTILSYTE